MSTRRCVEQPSRLRPDEPSPPLGVVDGRYRLREELGAGAFGGVYLADDSVRARTVAVKILRPGAWDHDEAPRFAREVQALDTAIHPGIVTLYDHGVDPHHGLFLVMEAVEGRTLRAHLDERHGAPLPLVEAIDIALEVLCAIDAAHAVGVVHRDLKPANVMVCGPFEVKLLDFGVALMTHEPRLTRKGLALGTLAYAAPEQARGEPEPASDLYAVGVMLYEMLAGRLPFPSNNDLEVAVAHQREQPPALNTQGVPPAVEQAVLRALEKAPAARFASAREMIEHLWTLRPGPPRPLEAALTLRGGAIAAPPPTPPVEAPLSTTPERGARLGRARAVALQALLVATAGLAHGDSTPLIARPPPASDAIGEADGRPAWTDTTEPSAAPQLVVSPSAEADPSHQQPDAPQVEAPPLPPTTTEPSALRQPTAKKTPRNPRRVRRSGAPSKPRHRRAAPVRAAHQPARPPTVDPPPASTAADSSPSIENLAGW